MFRSTTRYNIELCFYMGDDVRSSHLNYDPRWNNGTAKAFTQYINDLAFRTNVILSKEAIACVQHHRIKTSFSTGVPWCNG